VPLIPVAPLITHQELPQATPQSLDRVLPQGPDRWDHDKFDLKDTKKEKRTKPKQRRSSTIQNKDIHTTRPTEISSKPDLRLARSSSRLDDDDLQVQFRTISLSSLQSSTPSEADRTEKRPSISQKAKDQLIASMDRKDRKQVQKDIKIPQHKKIVDAPEFFPSSSFDLRRTASMGSPLPQSFTNSPTDLYHETESTQSAPKGGGTMLYHHLTSAGHYVLMTEQGVIVPTDYVYPPQYYNTSFQQGFQHGNPTQTFQNASTTQGQFNYYNPPFNFDGNNETASSGNNGNTTTNTTLQNNGAIQQQSNSNGNNNRSSTNNNFHSKFQMNLNQFKSNTSNYQSQNTTSNVIHANKNPEFSKNNFKKKKKSLSNNNINVNNPLTVSKLGRNGPAGNAGKG
jgi:hypothetical protein